MHWLLSSMIFLGLLYYLKNNFYDFSFKNIAESLAISGLISFVCALLFRMYQHHYYWKIYKFKN